MAETTTLLEKLDALVARFEEVSTLITDPAVIADQQRYVRLTKEYKDLEELMNARQEYANLLGNLAESKSILMTEDDAEMKEMAREEVAVCEERIPTLEEEIKLMLVPKDPEDAKNAILEIRGGLLVTSSVCTPSIVKLKGGSSRFPVSLRGQLEDIKKLCAL